MIEFHNEDNLNVPQFDAEHFVLWVNSIVEAHNKEVGDLQYYFMTDDDLLKLNIELLDHDFYTDIITVDACIDDLVMGEAYISIDRVMENAKNNEVVTELELARVIIHGCLHLLGYNDKSESEQELMTKKENWALSLLS